MRWPFADSTEPYRDYMMEQAIEIGGIEAVDVFHDEEDRGVPPLSEPRPKPTATVWVTREGQRIPVRDMKDQHLINTIRMLRRSLPLVPLMMMSELLQMDRYIAGAPDGAAMACEAEAAALGDMTDDEYLSRRYVTLPAMLAEAEKRGLQSSLK